MPERGLRGEIVLAIGCTDGMGFSAAKYIGMEGATIVVNSRREPNVTKAVNELKAAGVENVVGIKEHAAKKEGIMNILEQVVQKYGKFDHLILNYGVSPGMGSILTYTEEQYDKVFDVNVKSFWLWIKHSVEHMNKGGSIVMNASMGGYFPGDATPIYGVSKTAVMGLVKAAALELGHPKFQIRVNGICPGVIKTRFAGYQWQDPAEEKKRIGSYMLRRLGEPDEVGRVVAFLCSDEASYMTGENFQISGGSMVGSRL